jgi:cytochrome c oxidase cbb3-type subunit IV
VSSTYEFFAKLAQTWGLVYFFLVFLAALAYALWPTRARQQQFDETARLPLRED